MKAQRTCPNCRHVFEREADFCPGCGQKNREHVPSIADLFSDFFDHLFSLNFKLLRTVRDLIVPAKLSLAFSVGIVQRYVRPLQLFLVSLFLFLTVFHYSAADVNFEVQWQRLFKKDHIENYLNWKEYRQVRDSLLQDTTTHAMLDSVLVQTSFILNEEQFRESYDNGDFEMDINILQRPVQLTIDREGTNNDSVLIPAREWLYQDVDSILVKHEIKYIVDRIFVKQMIRFIRTEQDIFEYFINRFAWMSLLLLPMFAVWLKLMWREGYKYVEHLVFLMHLQSFVLLSLAFVLLINVFSDPAGSAAALIWGIGGTIYQLIAIWRFYGRQQSFLLLLVKLFASLIVFILLQSIVFLIGLMIGFALFDSGLF